MRFLISKLFNIGRASDQTAGLFVGVLTLAMTMMAGPAMAQDYDLAVQKLFANQKEAGGTIPGCIPGAPCSLRIEVENLGSDTYSGQFRIVDIPPSGWTLLPVAYPPGQDCRQSGTRIYCTTSGAIQLAPGDKIAWALPMESPPLPPVGTVENCAAIDWMQSTPDKRPENDGPDPCLELPVGDRPGPETGRPFTIIQMVGNTIYQDFQTLNFNGHDFGKTMDQTGGCLTPAPCALVYSVAFGDDEGTTGHYEGDIGFRAVFTDVQMIDGIFDFHSRHGTWRCAQLPLDPAKKLLSVGFECTAAGVTLDHMQYLEPLYVAARFTPRARMTYSTVTCATLSNTSDLANGVYGTDGNSPLDKEITCDRRRLEPQDLPPNLTYQPRVPNECHADNSVECYTQLTVRNFGGRHFFGDLTADFEFTRLDQIGLTGGVSGGWACGLPISQGPGKPILVSCTLKDAMVFPATMEEPSDMVVLRLPFSLVQVPEESDYFRLCTTLRHAGGVLVQSCDDTPIVRAP